MKNLDNGCILNEPSKQSLCTRVQIRRRSTQELDCIEDRISSWLESRGIIPESPSLKRHCYFNDKKDIASKCLSGWTTETAEDATKSADKKDADTVVSNGSPYKAFPNNELGDGSHRCIGSTILQRRGIKDLCLNLSNESTTLTSNISNSDQFSTSRATFDSKSNKSVLEVRRRMLGIEPLAESPTRYRSMQIVAGTTSTISKTDGIQVQSHVYKSTFHNEVSIEELEFDRRARTTIQHYDKPNQYSDTFLDKHHSMSPTRE